jgi:hypothetical protein
MAPRPVNTAPRLVLNLRWVILGLLFVAIFAGFQGGRYYLANRLQELGIASALAFFMLGTWRGLFLLPAAEWRRWVVGPVLLIGGIMLVSAVVFSLRHDGRFIYSFFSAREFLLAFVGPGVYLLCRSGLPVDDVRRVVWFTIFALMVNYLWFYTTMDLSAAFFSSDHTVSNLVTYDQWRGFRLKPPLFAIMVGLLGALMMAFQARGFRSFVFAVVVLGLGGYIWSIVQFRATFATILLALLVYPLFLRRVSRLPLLLVLSPLVILSLPVVADQAIQTFLGAEGGGIRARAFMAAFEYLEAHWLFGAGEDSAYGDSYQDIVAPYFFPSDIGLVGTAFKYGIIGLILYLWMHGKIGIALWRANISFRDRMGFHDPLTWALLLFMTAQTFNLVLNPGLAYAQGITLGAIALALARLETRPLDA